MSAINLKSITGITSITTPAGVDNQLTLHTNNTTERLRITSAGKVGINSTSPSSTLDVVGGYQALGLYRNDFTGNSGAGIELYFGRAKANGDLFNCAIVSAVGSDNTAQAGQLRFSVLDGGSMGEKLRINDTGWMGANQTTRDHPGQIAAFKNTSNVNSWLSVNVNNNTGIGGVVFGDSDAWAPAYVQYNHTTNIMQFISNGSERLRIKSDGSIQTITRSAGLRRMILAGSPTNTSFNIEVHDGATGTASGTIQGELGLYYNDGSTLSDTATIKFERGSGAANGAMTFFTNNAEKVRITSSGELWVGTTSGISNSGYGGFSLNGSSGSLLSLMHNGTEKLRLFGHTNPSIQYAGDLTFYSGVSGGTERARITSAGRVLIGTTTEGHGNADDLTVATAGGSLGHTGITIRSGTSSDGNIFFSDATSGGGETIGGIKYKHGGAGSNPETLNFIANGLTRATVGATYFYVDDGTNGRITLQPDSTNVNQILSTTTAFGSYCNLKYQAADHIFLYGGTERLRISSNGNVGINQSSPQVKLHLYDSSNATARTELFRISGGNRTADSFETGFRFFAQSPTTNGNRHITFTSNGNTGLTIQPYETSTGNAATDRNILLCPDGGNVSIKTTNTSQGVLQVNGDITAGYHHGGDMYGLLAKRKFQGGDALGGYAIRYASGYESPWIIGYNAGASYDNQITFGSMTTSDRNLSTGVTKRMVIDMETGKVGVNDTTNGWAEKLQVTADYGSSNQYAIAAKIGSSSGSLMRFGTTSGVCGSITGNATNSAYNTSSDYRLKENDVRITDGISRVKQLRPIKFNWKTDPSTTQDGFFAHEVSPVVPESVTGEKDAPIDEIGAGYQMIDHSKLVPLLTAALQEAISEIETLKTKVTALEGS